jgi:two-component system OmpR family response regulator
MRSLVIEDEPQIGAYLGRLLGQLHGIVDIVASVSDAQQALSNFKYDLAIVDRMLPDGDALDIVTALSQLPERPAIIMLTAKDTKEDVIDGLNCGADDYLGKPFEPQEFIAGCGPCCGGLGSSFFRRSCRSETSNCASAPTRPLWPTTRFCCGGAKP